MWPWLALAGLGALHGLNPLCGWPWLASGNLRRGLLAMAGGHALSLLLVAALVVCGIERGWLLPLGAVALLVRPCRSPALLSFLTATFHGTGLMLVPALMPLCMAGTPAREIVAGGSWLSILVALAIHLAAMLATAGALRLSLRRFRR